MLNIRRTTAVLSLLCLVTLGLTSALVPRSAIAGDVLRPGKNPNTLTPGTPDGSEFIPVATLATDQEAYLPGDMVIITGEGFQPGENVEVAITLSATESLEPWTVPAAGDGSIATHWFIPANLPLGEVMTTAADGQTSGLKAEASFVSGNAILKWNSLIPDSVCPEGYFEVCLCLTESCEGASPIPLPNEPVIVYFTTGTCDSADFPIYAETLYTDALGKVYTWLTAPVDTGNYTLRARYDGSVAKGADGDLCEGVNSTLLCRSLRVTNSQDHPPTINFGPNVNIFMCVPTEICVTYQLTDPEGIAGLHEENFSGFGEFRDQVNGIYFTPDTAGKYVLIAKTTDPCGLYDIDTVVLTINMNDPPSISFGPDLYYACTPPPGPLCLPYTVSDPDGLAGSHESLISGPGSIYPELNQVCFEPSGPGVYEFIVRVVDTCSLSDYDTIKVTIGGAGPPTITFRPDTSVVLCAPGEVCVPYTVSDPDGLQGLIETQTAGPGTIDTLNNKICFNATVSGSHTIIARVDDSCGGFDYDTIVVNVSVGDPPTIAFGPDYGTGSCTPTQICVPYTVSDPQGLAGLIEALVSGPTGAAIDTALNRVCFTPTASGIHTVIAKVTDPCGAVDYDTIRVTVNLNGPPILTFGPDTTIALCSLSQVCVQYVITDPNGPSGHVETLIATPPGATFSAATNTVCWTPTGEGSYTVIVKVKDPCNAEDQDTIVVTINLNDPPVVTAPKDTTIFLCDTATVCLPGFSATDPNGNLADTSISIGTLAGGVVCFKADTAGYYRIIFCVTDSCGASDCDTAVAHVIINSSPACSIPGDTAVIDCFPSELCLLVSASDVDGNFDRCEIVSGPGTLAAGQWCYTPTDDEAFDVVIRCIDSCGAFCEDTFHVSFDFNEPPVCEFNTPAPPICLPDTAFVPFGVTDPDGDLDTCYITSGPGWLVGNTWFYEPSPGEHVAVTICCYDECGDSCCISFEITYPTPQPPICQIPSFDTTFAFCAPTQVCIPIAATSSNPPVVCSLVAGVGSLVEGVWCYTPAGPEVDTVTVRCTDICGEFCEESFIVRFDLNDPPSIILQPDSSLEYCATANTICVNYSVSDPEGLAGLLESLISGPAGAAIDTALNRVCFVAPGPGNYTVIVSVADACAASDRDTVVITVTPSTPPVCNLPGNTTFRLCGSQQICLPVSATADDTPVNCVVTSGVGTVANGFWCYTPTGPGNYDVTITCTDACGATCSGSFRATVIFNGPPTIAFGPDTSLFQCAPTLICLNYTVSDDFVPNKWIESVISAPAGYLLDTVQNRICFTPPNAGTHTIIVRVTDSCGLFDQDTINVNVNLNDPPVIAFGPDSTVFQCIAAPICLNYTISDPDGLAGLIETKISGPGTLDTAQNRVCFTPTGSGIVTIIAKVTDPCGLFDQDTINVNVTLNLPPVCNLPRDTTIFQCAPTQICLPVSATDPNGNFSMCSMMAGPGLLSNGQWCYTPTGDQQVSVTIRCADSCGVYCEGTFNVNIVVNDPPVCNVPPDTSFTFLCSLQTITLPVSATDANGNLSHCSLVESPGELVGGNWVFTPSEPGEYCVTVECRDSCNAFCQSTFCVTVNLDTVDCDCIFKVSIGGGEPTDGLNGQQVVVPIVLEMADIQMGGFDLILCYDETGIFLTQVAKGPSIAAWEYFTYRLGAFGNCVGNCPSGIVRLIGLVDMNNGQPITNQNAWKPLGTMANLTFVITSDRNFIGQCIPITWCWYQCGDNTIASRTGDSLFMEINYDFDSCLSNPKGTPYNGICFENGRICILEPPDDRGDLNLNGIANEIGDAVLYTNFFIHGQSVWDPVWKDVQLLASDINDDGLVLTIADLVYLIRIITGDEQPFPPGGNPKLISANPVEVTTYPTGESLTLSWNSELAIGGAHFIVEVPSDVTVGEISLMPDVSNMTLRTNRVGNELRILVFSDTTEIIPAGSHAIVTVAMAHPELAVITTHDLSTEDGWVMPSILQTAKASVPKEFTLAQNYPNPFNAGTTIRFGVEESSEFNVVIYDILGRRVWGTSGHAEAGWIEVPWDGRGEDGNDLASGLYLYRVQTGSGTQTRKMTLLK